jgi:hypothetical protein
MRILLIICIKMRRFRSFFFNWTCFIKCVKSLTCGTAAHEHLGPRDANSIGNLPRSISTHSASSIASTNKRKSLQKNSRKTPTKIIGDDVRDEYFQADDLNSLRVTLPRVAKDNKDDYAFVISVENSVENENSTRQEQLRYYAEFYALENKLKGEKLFYAAFTSGKYDLGILWIFFGYVVINRFK